MPWLESADGWNNPRNATSVLRLKPAVASGLDAMPIWESVAGRTCFQVRTANFAFPASLEPIANDIRSQHGVTSCTNRLTAWASLGFYQIGVE